MKPLRLTTFALTILALATQVHGQAASEENVAYEHLKVLEPFIGTWQTSGINEQGTKWEYRLTYSWNVNRNMLLGEGLLRVVSDDGAQPEIPWHRLGYVWNDKTKTIEMARLHVGSGSISMASVTSKGNGKFAVSLIRNTSQEEFTEESMVTVTDTQVVVNRTNRKNAAGEALPDETIKLSRSN